jgi:hypothetical protein
MAHDSYYYYYSGFYSNYYAPRDEGPAALPPASKSGAEAERPASAVAAVGSIESKY